MLASLPESWETLKVSLTNTAPGGVVSMDFIKSGILNEEMRRRSQRTSTSQSDVLAAESRGRSKIKKYTNQKPRRSKSSGRYANIKCYNCGENGHIKKYCRKPKDKHETGDEQTNAIDEFNVVHEPEQESINLATQGTSWVIDSGATVHVTSRSECFTSYTQGEFGVVRMGNNDLSKVVGKGDVNLTTMDGSTLILKDVRHVPDMRLNLISVERLDGEGFCTTFRNGMCKISRGSLVVAKGLKMSKLYVVQENHSEGVNYA